MKKKIDLKKDHLGTSLHQEKVLWRKSKFYLLKEKFQEGSD